MKSLNPTIGKMRDSVGTNTYKVIVTTSIGLSKFEELKPAQNYRQALTMFAEEIQKDHVFSVLLYVGDTKIAEFQPTLILASKP